jgi:ribosomal protein S19E (S16A)
VNTPIDEFAPELLLPILGDIAKLGAARRQDIPVGNHKLAALCARKMLRRVRTTFGVGYTLGSKGAVQLGRGRKVAPSTDRVANGLIRRAVLEHLTPLGYVLERVVSSSLMTMTGSQKLYVYTRHHPLSARGVRSLIKRYYGELLLREARLCIATSRPHTLKHLQARYEGFILLLDVGALYEPAA